jgi:6-pyruvoyltetrahydropterin/6-carboxytetrahydropterin synthase
VFGDQFEGRYGIGSNFTAWFVFHGPVDPKTGMMINVSSIKQRLGALLEAQYDHKFINADSSAFVAMLPTVENLATQLLADAGPLFDDHPVQLVACHLRESKENEATAYIDGRVERHLWLGFSAARSTRSPHLSEAENKALFGAASARSGHGHYYRLRLTLDGPVESESGLIAPDDRCRAALDALHLLLDHRNLNTDVPQLQQVPTTTECLSRFIYSQVSGQLPVKRVQLWENPDFFAEYLGEAQCRLGLRSGFQAAHRLHGPQLSDEENVRLYANCNNLNGHGHRYIVETTVAGKIDERSGMLFSLEQLSNGIDRAVRPWKNRHLDLETDDFQDMPSTGENIIGLLSPRLDTELDAEVARVRLWETPNNRFTLRRQP